MLGHQWHRWETSHPIRVSLMNLPSNVPCWWRNNIHHTNCLQMFHCFPWCRCLDALYLWYVRYWKKHQGEIHVDCFVLEIWICDENVILHVILKRSWADSFLHLLSLRLMTGMLFIRTLVIFALQEKFFQSAEDISLRTFPIRPSKRL